MLAILWKVATSRLGLVTIAASLAFAAGHYRGYSRADRKADLAALQSQIAVVQADVTAARKAERIARDQAAMLADISLQQQEYLDDLESELASRPERAACRVTDDDARRLRRIDAGEGGGAARSAPIPLVGDPRNGTGAKGR